MNCSTPGSSVLHYFPEFAQTHVHWTRNVISPSHPLLLSSPFAFSISRHQVFSSESTLRIRWPKYWRFGFSINSSNEYSGLISCRIDWLDLLPVQGTLKSLLQHHISKALILWRSDFFMVQLSHPYMTPRKTIALTFAGTFWLFAGLFDFCQTFWVKGCLCFLIHCLGLSEPPSGWA